MTITAPAFGLLRFAPLLVFALAVVLVALVGERHLSVGRTPLLGPDAVLVAVAIVTGLALLGTGALTIAAGVSARPGTYAFAAGLAWFGPYVAPLAVAIPLLRSALVASSIFVLPLILMLVLSVAPRTGSRPLLLVGVILLIATLIAVAVSMFLTYAPLYDAECPMACASGTALVDLGRSERAVIGDASQLVGAMAGALLVIVAVLGWRDRPAMSSRVVIVGGGGLAGLGGGVLAATRMSLGADALGHAVEDADWVSFVTLCTGLSLVTLGLLLEIVRHVQTRRRIHDIAEGLNAAASLGSLESRLAHALVDQDLRVGYPSDEGIASVDASGAPVDLEPTAGQTLTVLSRAGSSIVVIRHREDVDSRALMAAFGPTLLVALDNERLRGIRLAQLRDLQASRSRIVELGDAERRRIERDLHDGAQQRLLAIAFDVRLIRLAAERDGRPDAALILADAEAIILSTVEDLRRVCHGIHPQVLSQAGLGAALVSLADEAQVPLDIAFTLTERPPLAVETAAYEVVVEALGQAVSRGAPALEVVVERVDDNLVVEAIAEGTGAPDVRTRLADRVGAVGGLVAADASSHGGRLWAQMPCV